MGSGLLRNSAQHRTGGQGLILPTLTSPTGSGHWATSAGLPPRTAEIMPTQARREGVSEKELPDQYCALSSGGGRGVSAAAATTASSSRLRAVEPRPPALSDLVH